jgi:hypothetical protein
MNNFQFFLAIFCVIVAILDFSAGNILLGMFMLILATINFISVHAKSKCKKEL